MNTEIAIAIIAAIAVLAYTLLRKRGKRNPRWTLRYSKGCTLVPQGDGWTLRIGPGDEPHDVALIPAPKLAGAVTVQVAVEGGPYVAVDYAENPAKITLMIERGKDTDGHGEFAFWRWYSREAIPLTPGEHTLTVPLSYEHWGPVEGTGTREQFAACLANARSLSLVFGSDGGRAHGVRGVGTITLRSWSVQ